MTYGFCCCSLSGPPQLQEKEKPPEASHRWSSREPTGDLDNPDNDQDLADSPVPPERTDFLSAQDVLEPFYRHGPSSELQVIQELTETTHSGSLSPRTDDELYAERKNIERSHGEVWERKLSEVNLPRRSASEVTTIRKNASRERLAARDALMKYELRIIKAFNRYDTQKVGQIDFLQFRNLLCECSIGTAPDECDMKWILNVLGSDSDASFDERIVVIGMFAWYASQYVPETVTLMMKAYDENTKGAFDSFKVQEFLCEKLNEGKLVRKEEVEFVLSAFSEKNEDKIYKAQLEVPIAVWYLNVKGPPASRTFLWKRRCGCAGTNV